jgi:hypothetical protein
MQQQIKPLEEQPTSTVADAKNSSVSLHYCGRFNNCGRFNSKIRQLGWILT